MPMYPELLVIPMREELTRVGVEEARTAEAVDEAVKNAKGTLMVIVNSICGCAAGKMRPAVRLALQQSPNKPSQSISVFAGQDQEATARARELFAGVPPSSPSIGFMRDGKLIYFMPRSAIESRDAASLASELVAAFQQHCADAVQQ
jgi:putative YphP/YqiW family bacilliredoxin